MRSAHPGGVPGHIHIGDKLAALQREHQLVDERHGLARISKQAGLRVTGFALGVVEGLTKVFWPQASATVVFVLMVIVLLTRPRGLFGKAA